MGELSAWLPWIYSLLALAAGWILRWWYDEGKFSELRDRLEAKDNDIYHLNEAHNLLLEDKKSKISGNTEELAMKDRVIKELTEEVKQLRSSKPIQPTPSDKPLTTKSKEKEKTKKRKNKISKKKAIASPVSIVSMIDKKAKKKSENALVDSAHGQAPDGSISSKSQDNVKSLSKKKLREKLSKSKEKIKELRSEKEELAAKLSIESQPTVKEVPVTITKTILVKEKIDRKKLKKVLKKIPLKVTRKESSEVTEGS